MDFHAAKVASFPDPVFPGRAARKQEKQKSLRSFLQRPKNYKTKQTMGKFLDAMDYRQR
jgi:hypothetical protein